jgi:uncharacterized protein
LSGAGQLAVNFKKHGVDFSEAATVFSDRRRVSYFDLNHSLVEDRFSVVGDSYLGRVLFVVYVERKAENVKKNYFRIISARIANQAERRRYLENSR